MLQVAEPSVQGTSQVEKAIKTTSLGIARNALNVKLIAHDKLHTQQ